MDIAAMSTALSQGKLMQQVSVSVTKMAMNTGEAQMNELLQMLQQNTQAIERSVTPHLGQSIDAKV